MDFYYCLHCLDELIAVIQNDSANKQKLAVSSKVTIIISGGEGCDYFLISSTGTELRMSF